MRIAFLGTPDFALPSLDMLVKNGYDVAAVFCQPDKPVGRHGRLTPPPVKARAIEYGIPVHQPARIKSPEGAKLLADVAPDLMITAAFGQILSAENLAVPKYGCINVHGSLLPKYRGAAPIQWAVINGEKTTGVTTMLTDVGLDTGDMLYKLETAIGPDETAGELFDRIAVLGAEALKTTLEMLKKGELRPEKQNEAEATHCRMLKKEDGHVDFTQPAQKVHDLIRGTSPWPGAYCTFGDCTIKLKKARVVDCCTGAAPGEVFCSDAKGGLIIACGTGAIEVLELQAPGCKCMDAHAYLCGKSIPLGTVLD